MMKIQIDSQLLRSEIAPLKMSEAGDYFGNMVDAQSLLAGINEPSHSFDRKQLCDYLGIAESTLSGWLREDRVPRMACLAISLAHLVDALHAEFRRLDSDAKAPRVVQHGDSFMLCDFSNPQDSEVGRVVASGFVSRYEALKRASVEQLARLLKRTLPAVDLLIDTSLTDMQRDDAERIQKDIQDTLLKVFAPDRYRELQKAQTEIHIDLDDHSGRAAAGSADESTILTSKPKSKSAS